MRINVNSLRTRRVPEPAMNHTPLWGGVYSHVRQIMNKFFKVLGIFFLLALIALAVLIGYGAYSGSKLDVSSKTFVDEIVPAIVSSWSSEDVIKHASPQLRQIANDEQLNQLMLEINGVINQWGQTPLISIPH